MTYHESYGDIPAAMLALYGIRGITPGDHFTFEVFMGEGNFEAFYNHIEANVNALGKYAMPFPFTV